MTAQDARTVAAVTRLKEGLYKMREELLKAYSNNKNIRVSEKLKEWGLMPLVINWMVEDKYIKEYDIPGTTGHGLGRRLQWNYKNNPDGIVDQALIDHIIRRTREYDTNRRAKKKLERENEQVVRKEEKISLKKLPGSNEATIGAIVLWIDEELAKEEQVPGYLRTATKLMYQRIKDILGNIKPSIDKLKEVLNEINL